MPTTFTLAGYPEMPRLTVGDSGEVELRFNVVGVFKDENGDISYTLEAEMTKIEPDSQNLNSITRRAAEGAYDDPPMVKGHFTPAGS